MLATRQSARREAPEQMKWITREHPRVHRVVVTSARLRSEVRVDSPVLAHDQQARPVCLARGRFPPSPQCEGQRKRPLSRMENTDRLALIPKLTPKRLAGLASPSLDRKDLERHRRALKDIEALWQQGRRAPESPIRPQRTGPAIGSPLAHELVQVLALALAEGAQPKVVAAEQVRRQVAAQPPLPTGRGRAAPPRALLVFAAMGPR